MPRQETLLDPADGPLPAFACELRALRAAAGLTYRQLAMAAHYSHVILVKAAGGGVLPSWPVTQQFVIACGATEEDVKWWRKHWETTRDAIASADGASDGRDGSLSTREPAEGDPTPPRIAAGLIAVERQDRTVRELYVPERQKIRSPADFARALRKLKISAGDPSFRRMARRWNVPASTLADQCDPARRRFDSETVIVFLKACGVPASDHRQWLDILEEISYRTERHLVGHRPPVPQIDLTAVQTPAAFAQALKTLMDSTELSYATLVDRARMHPGSWPGGRSTLCSKINQAVQNNTLLDHHLVESFVRCCYCESLDYLPCSSHCHTEDVQRWLTVYDGLVLTKPSAKDLVSIEDGNADKADPAPRVADFEAITTLNELGRYLQELRDKEHSPLDLAVRSGGKIGRSRISEIENARRDPVTERELRVFMSGLRCTPRHIDQVVKALTRCTATPVKESPGDPDATSPAPPDAYPARLCGAENNPAPQEEKSDDDPAAATGERHPRWKSLWRRLVR